MWASFWSQEAHWFNSHLSDDVMNRNGRAQPFQTVAILPIQQLAGCGRLRKTLQRRANWTNFGLDCGLRVKDLRLRSVAYEQRNDEGIQKVIQGWIEEQKRKLAEGMTKDS
jgi:hypothetical protein